LQTSCLQIFYVQASPHAQTQTHHNWSLFARPDCPSMKIVDVRQRLTKNKTVSEIPKYYIFLHDENKTTDEAATFVVKNYVGSIARLQPCFVR